jgi:hypothetical protein
MLLREKKCTRYNIGAWEENTRGVYRHQYNATSTREHSLSVPSLFLNLPVASESIGSTYLLLQLL